MRYDKATRIQRNGKVHYGPRPKLDTEKQATDIYYEIQAEDTLQKVAFRAYRDAKLWWLVADFNDIVDPFAELVPGETLRLPNRARLYMELLK